MRDTPPVRLTPAQQAAFDELKPGAGTVSRDSRHASHLGALVRKGIAFTEKENRRLKYFRVDIEELHRMGFK